MDYRCPYCQANLKTRKVSQAIIARMEIDCPSCKRTVKLNLHPAELLVIFVGFGSTLVLGLLGYWLEVRGLMLAAFVAAMLGAMAIPLVENVYLRAWPRYVRDDK